MLLFHKYLVCHSLSLLDLLTSESTVLREATKIFKLPASPSLNCLWPIEPIEVLFVPSSRYRTITDYAIVIVRVPKPHSLLWVYVAKRYLENIAKGTTDPRVEFISQALDQISISEYRLRFNF